MVDIRVKPNLENSHYKNVCCIGYCFKCVSEKCQKFSRLAEKMENQEVSIIKVENP